MIVYSDNAMYLRNSTAVSASSHEQLHNVHVAAGHCKVQGSALIL